MTHATDVLRAEHTLILRALDLVERASDRLDGGIALPDGWWSGLLQWLQNFADRRHHSKEEQALFPAMARAGIPAAPGGPIGTMLEEHQTGRGLMGVMAAGGTAERAGAARRYVGLLRAHIEKENSVLFPLADAVIADSEQRALLAQFAADDVEGPTAALDRLTAALA